MIGIVYKETVKNMRSAGRAPQLRSARRKKGGENVEKLRPQLLRSLADYSGKS